MTWEVNFGDKAQETDRRRRGRGETWQDATERHTHTLADTDGNVQMRIPNSKIDDQGRKKEDMQIKEVTKS